MYKKISGRAARKSLRGLKNDGLKSADWQLPSRPSRLGQALNVFKRKFGFKMSFALHTFSVVLPFDVFSLPPPFVPLCSLCFVLCHHCYFRL